MISWTVQDDAALVAGDEVLPDTRVVLVVSHGPGAAYRARTSSTSPSTRRRAALAAIQLSSSRGSSCSATTSRPAASSRQTPAVDDAGRAGRDGDVALSKGPDVVPFPDLDRPDLRHGAGDARRRRLASTACSARTEGTFVSASIDGEPVEPGEQFLRGTAVDLVFL